MAVGMIITCDVCGESYDEGKTSHWFQCDGGAAKKRDEDQLKRLKSQAVEVTIEEFHKRIRALEKSSRNRPYNGPIG